MFKHKTSITAAAVALAAGVVISANAITGPSSSDSPYLVRAVPGVVTKSILTAGDSAGGYRLAGIPDGLGAFDNGDGTFTLLVNHEIPAASGVVRAHGATGAFVSKWIVSSDDLSVLGGEDLIRNVHAWHTATSTWVPNQPVAFARFCSASLGDPGSFYNPATGRGYDGRIFVNGEENGVEGRAFAHLMNGDTYELPALGKLAFENAVPHPAAGDATVVVGLDDGPGGQVYMYRGTKLGPGAATPIDAAGLGNGTLYGIKVDGLTTETNGSTLSPDTPFTVASFGDVRSWTGAQLDAASVSAGVTTFQRPEDGTWDPIHPNDFYFVTTASFSGNSRLWRLRFRDAASPVLGGTITMLLRGDEGQRMLDNIAIDRRGRLILQEDPGGQSHIAKVWAYDTATGAFAVVAQHDPQRFLPGAADFLTFDEESSGVVDAASILGEGWYILGVQAHYPTTAELYEGGQLLALHVPPGKKF